MLLASELSLLGPYEPFQAYSKNTLTEIWPSYWPIRIGLRSLKTASTECTLSLARIKPPPGSRSKWHGIYRCFEAELFNLRWKIPLGLMLVINTYASRIRADRHASRVLERTATRLRIEFVAEIINYGARNWITGDGKGKSDVVGDDIRNGNGRINFWRRQLHDRNYTPR